MAAVLREPEDIFQYIRRSFKRGALKDNGAALLYQNKWCVKAVFQSLSSLAQQYILRIAIVGKSNNIFGADELNSWVRPGAPKVFIELRDLRIVNRRKKNGKVLIKLNAQFCEQLRALLCEKEVGLPFAQVPTKFTFEECKKSVENQSEKKWHEVLKFLLADQMQISESLDIVQVKANVDLNVKMLFYWAELVRYQCTECMIFVPPNTRKCPGCTYKFREDTNRFRDGASDMPRQMTGKAYNFVLKARSNQAWTVVQAILENACEDTEKTISLLALFLMLGYCRSGHGYDFTNLNLAQKECIVQLRSLGFIALVTKREFFPSEFIINMPFGAVFRKARHPSLMGASEKNDPNRLKIVVETNFKVYAYTKSELDKLLLRQFVHEEDSMPNMTIGKIKRDMVCVAFNKGIRPRQIIKYLEDHLHEHTHPKIPINVEEQIGLWYKELNPVDTENVTEYSDFESNEEFDIWKTFAEENDVLIDFERVDYPDPNSRRSLSRLIIEEEADDLMIEFSRQRKQGTTSATAVNLTE